MKFIILIQSISHSDCFSVSQSLIHLVTRWLVPSLSHSPHQSFGRSAGRSVGQSICKSFRQSVKHQFRPAISLWISSILNLSFVKKDKQPTCQSVGHWHGHTGCSNINRPTNKLINQSIDLSINPSLNLFTNPFIHKVLFRKFYNKRYKLSFLLQVYIKKIEGIITSYNFHAINLVTYFNRQSMFRFR